MKKYLSIFLPILLSACVSLPPTVESIRANPGGKVSMQSSISSETLYKMLSDQSKACFTTSFWYIGSDFYPDKTGTISMRMTSIGTSGVIWAADITPAPQGSNIEYYYYTEKPDGLSRPMIAWIKNGPPLLCDATP